MVAIQGYSQLYTRGTQSAFDRSSQIKDLTRKHPELVPAASLLSDLAQTSEAVSEVTASHDPTVSELLAFGQAIDITREKSGVRTVPIVAIAAGAAGELLRLVRLKEEQVGWGGENFTLDNLTAKNGEKGWWTGNGTPIKQLVFAEAQGHLGYWLAVRYHGAVSIFRPLLRSDPEFTTSHGTGRAHLPSSRLDVNHVVTLPENGAPFSDVTFNPWNHQQVATIDQEGSWSVWVVDATTRFKQKGRGTISKISNGHIFDDEKQDYAPFRPMLDGWGAVLWAQNPNIIAVAGRTAFAVFDIETSSRQALVPELTSSRTGDWILDVKKSSRDPSSVFVATSLCVYWLHISKPEQMSGTAELKSNAQCLLTWKHFRDREDTSLRLNILDILEGGRFHDDTEHALSHPADRDYDSTTIKALLYSCLSGMVTVFSFQYAMSPSNKAFSAFDPYRLKLSTEADLVFRLGQEAHNLHPNTQIATLVLKAVKTSPSDDSRQPNQSQSHPIEGVNFYQLAILSQDLTLSEGLYAEGIRGSGSPIVPSINCTRKKLSKTPAKILDNFIVPDIFCDKGYQIFENNLGISILQQDLGQQSLLQKRSDEDPWTITLAWLETEIRTSLSDRARSFDEALESLYVTVKEDLALQEVPGQTLHHLLNTAILIEDIDKASANLADFTENAVRIKTDEVGSLEGDNGEREQIALLDVLTPSIRQLLGVEDHVQLSTVYDSLVKTWIAPLSRRTPGRARVTLEKLLRILAAQLCLATYYVRVDKRADSNKEATRERIADSELQFVLPVRRRVSVTNLRKGKEPTERSSSPIASSQISQGVGSLTSSPFRALPTPELTPSLHSKNSKSFFTASEDPASLRLKAYASLAHQPALPIKMSDLLNNWQVGADPTNYDWEAAQQAFNDEDESENEARATQRQRAERRRKRLRQETMGASSQPQPKRLGASQPHVAQGMQGSSQPTESVGFASQIEPGPFGGRPAKLKKKKRTSGF